MRRLLPARLLTRESADAAIQSKVADWENAYTMLAEWLLQNAEPAVDSRARPRWQRRREQLEGLVKPFEEALQCTVGACDREAQMKAFRCVLHETYRREQAMQRERAREGLSGRAVEDEMQTTAQTHLVAGLGRNRAGRIFLRWKVADKLLAILETFLEVQHQASPV